VSLIWIIGNKLDESLQHDLKSFIEPYNFMIDYAVRYHAADFREI